MTRRVTFLIRSSQLKILHYLPGLPPVRGGGMIKYALDLIESEHELGHEVYLLVPGRFSCFHKDTSKIVKTKWKNHICYSIINPLPVSEGRKVSDIKSLYQEGNTEIYTYFLRKTNPDVIHLHSLMGLHLSFMKAAHEMHIPIVHTTHDYYGLCPNVILLNDGKQCIKTDGSQCDACMSGNLTAKKVIWEQSGIYRFLKSNRLVNWLEYSQKFVPVKIAVRSCLKKNKMEQEISHCLAEVNHNHAQAYQNLQNYYREMFEYVTKFHYNSVQSKEIFEQYLGNISGEVVQISNRTIADHRKKRVYDKTLRIGFIGRGTYKGFDILKEALQNMYIQDMKDIECHVYFNPKEKLPKFIIGHEPFDEKDTEKIYNSIDILVLPSICKETFGMVILEALGYGVPVIISENVGAKELLTEHENMGIVIEPTVDALQETLTEIYCNRGILERMNRAICNWEKQFCYEDHVNKIIDLYHTVAGTES